MRQLPVHSAIFPLNTQKTFDRSPGYPLSRGRQSKGAREVQCLFKVPTTDGKQPSTEGVSKRSFRVVFIWRLVLPLPSRRNSENCSIACLAYGSFHLEE